jgi:hypothetical protein
MHRDHQVFADALHDCRTVLLSFYSKEDGTRLERTCAPMDFGPSRRAKNKSDRYHFWDYDSDTQSHVLSLLPEQIVEMASTGNQFDPAGFVTWSTTSSPWFVRRDWGPYS